MATNKTAPNWYPARLPGPLHHLENGLLDVTPSGDVATFTARNVRESRLIRLPTEIRDIIFSYALSGQNIRPIFHIEDFDRITAHHKLLLPDTLRYPHQHRFSLLRACRQIYTETPILPYSLSTFKFPFMCDIGSWLQEFRTQSGKAELLSCIQKFQLIALPQCINTTFCTEWIVSDLISGVKRVHAQIPSTWDYSKSEVNRTKVDFDTRLRSKGIETSFEMGRSYREYGSEFISL
ncbi:hypothetical protein EK21DRAFT_93412 [Setomelanomma holmii]|uniref:Uncharacterized protein n=1 Tax=Setomelanomma holmii TaxID=210430 RepID=A0A9P4H157_9PLEO|nr:hypothetical protein EK21DRAFT_93412 [Setomelanomma holmii]